MKQYLFESSDPRQTTQWGEYLKGIGWHVEKIDDIYCFIRPLFFGRSMIKVQHAKGPFPFAKLDVLAKKHNAFAIIIEPHGVGYSEEVFRKNGYRKSHLRFTHTATIKIDLAQSEESLFRSFSENARRNIKKAQSNNLIIRRIPAKKDTKKEYLALFYSLLKNLTKMKHFYIPAVDEYEKKMQAFQKTSDLFFAFEKGLTDPIAVVWFASFGNVLSYFQTGITKRGYETLANYLLVWEGLKYGKKKGLTVFDFESIYDPRFPKDKKGFIHYTGFKKRFHGEVIEYPTPQIKFYSRFFRLLYTIEGIFNK